MAWLNATPKGAKKSRRAHIDMLAENAETEPEYNLPEVIEAYYLISTLSEIGEAKLAGDKLVSIQWPDIEAWTNATGTRLTPAEMIAIKNLSGVYVSQFYDSQDNNCMSPHIAAPQNRDVIEDKMKSLFAMLRGKTK